MADFGELWLCNYRQSLFDGTSKLGSTWLTLANYAYITRSSFVFHKHDFLDTR